MHTVCGANSVARVVRTKKERGKEQTKAGEREVERGNILCNY